jgi:hypothetical protein
MSTVLVAATMDRVMKSIAWMLLEDGINNSTKMKMASTIFQTTLSPSLHVKVAPSLAMMVAYAITLALDKTFMPSGTSLSSKVTASPSSLAYLTEKFLMLTASTIS